MVSSPGYSAQVSETSYIMENKLAAVDSSLAFKLKIRITAMTTNNSISNNHNSFEIFLGDHEIIISLQKVELLAI